MPSRWIVASCLFLLLVGAVAPADAQTSNRSRFEARGWTLVRQGNAGASSIEEGLDLWKDQAGNFRNGYGWVVDDKGKVSDEQPMWVGPMGQNGSAAGAAVAGTGGPGVTYYLLEDSPADRHKVEEYAISYNDGTKVASGIQRPENPMEWQMWVIRPVDTKSKPIVAQGRGTVLAPVFAAPGEYAAGNDDGSDTDDSAWDTPVPPANNDAVVSSGTWSENVNQPAAQQPGTQPLGFPRGSGGNLMVKVRDTTPPVGMFGFVPEDTNKLNRVSLLPAPPRQIAAATLGLSKPASWGINAFPPQKRTAVMKMKGRNFFPPEDESFTTWGKEIFDKQYKVPYGQLRPGDEAKIDGTENEGKAEILTENALDLADQGTCPGFQGLFVPARVNLRFEPGPFADNSTREVNKTWKLLADGQEIQEPKVHRFDVPNFPAAEGSPKYEFVCEMKDDSGNKTTWKLPIWVFELKDKNGGTIEIRQIDFKHERGD